MAQIVLKHRGAGCYTQSDALCRFRCNTGADCATRAHEAVHIRRKLRQEQVKTLQTGGRTHKIAMVKREHHRIPAFGVKNIRHMLFHAPVQMVDAFQEKTVLIRKGCVNMIIF